MFGQLTILRGHRGKVQMRQASFPFPRWTVVRGTLGTAMLTLLGTLPAAAQGGATEPAASGFQWLDTALHWTVRAIELLGIGAIVIGANISLLVYLYQVTRDGLSEAGYRQFRASLGRSILLGLEFLVAADIINTVAVDPTLESVAVLAAIVLIRTFLSFALEVEIGGKWPWRKADE